MCKLLHCISARIVACILELIDFYVYAVHEIFGKDAVVISKVSICSLLNEYLYFSP